MSKSYAGEGIDIDLGYFLLLLEVKSKKLRYESGINPYSHSRGVLQAVFDIAVASNRTIEQLRADGLKDQIPAIESVLRKIIVKLVGSDDGAYEDDWTNQNHIEKSFLKACGIRNPTRGDDQ